MGSVQLMQTDLTYNVTLDNGEEYTVLVMEDFYSGCFSTDVYNSDSEPVEDEEIVLEISKLIEDKRG